MSDLRKVLAEFLGDSFVPDSKPRNDDKRRVVIVLDEDGSFVFTGEESFTPEPPVSTDEREWFQNELNSVRGMNEGLKNEIAVQERRFNALGKKDENTIRELKTVKLSLQGSIMILDNQKDSLKNEIKCLNKRLEVINQLTTKITE